MDTQELRAGVTRVTITPPIGIPMVGFAGRGPADGLHDDLTATALVLEGPPADSTKGGRSSSVNRVAIIACDLLWISKEIVQSVRSTVSKLTDIPDGNVLIACSHTHFGPATDSRHNGEGEQVAPYVDNLVNLLAGAVLMARARTAPCRLGFGTGEARIGINRRERKADGRMVIGQNPDGTCDTRVAVLRIDADDGQPIATVLNYACHPVSLSGQCTHISADFPGVARQLVENQTGSTCMFLQGAAANINPLLKSWDWSHPIRLGLPLGAEAVRVYWGITMDSELARGGISLASSQLELPPLLPESVEAGEEAVADLEEQRRSLISAGNTAELSWTERRLDRIRSGLEALRGGTPLPSVPGELSALRVGADTGLITAPGEIFTEIGHSIISRSPFKYTLYSGYTDGSVGYVPTRSAYPEGGYEVTHTCRVAPEAGEMIEEESVRLLTDVYQSHQPG